MSRVGPASGKPPMVRLGTAARRVVEQAGIEALRQRADGAISSGMTADEFRTIREALGLTQAALAKVLGYSSVMSVSHFERTSNPREVPLQTAMLMQAFKDGWRPPGWPE